MKLSADNLPGQLAGRLLPVYLVSGDEPLLVGEALDLIRARARALGFEERQLLFIEKSPSGWEEALGASQNRSLFASRRILELRLASSKPGAGAAALLKLIAAADDGLLLLIVTGRLEREAQGAEWMRAVQARGAWLPVWPPTAAQFPDWLRQRLRLAGLDLTGEAVALLVAATEGNLLAAQQEIEKMRLRFGGGARLGLAELSDAFGDGARFSVLALTEAIAAGDAARALRVLAGLRAEGDEPVRLLWWLLRALRAQQGAPGALPRARLVARAARADRVAKGQAHGDAWEELALLTAELCGRRTLPLPRFAVLAERSRA